MEYLSIANSKILMGIVVVLISMVTAQALYFYKIGKKRAIELNISNEKIRKAVKAAVISSIVPSIAIIIALLTLTPVLGLPIAWGRLAVIGSLMYEVVTATIGATSMGVEGLAKSGYSPQVFANSVWMMTLGVFPTFVWVVFFLKKYKEQIKKSASRDIKWGSLLTATIMLAVFSNFTIPSVLKGGNDLMALSMSGLTMLVLTVLIKRFNIKWLAEYSLSFSMIVGMLVVLIVNV